MKKILFITMDCWSSLNSATTANTFASLFKNYDSEKLAGICLREEIPTSDKCSSYFIISENSILKSIFNPRLETGECFFKGIKPSEQYTKDIKITRKRYSAFGEKRRRIFLFARELVWLLGKWKSGEFKKFIDEFKPDAVIYGMEGYCYFHRIVRYILKRTKAEGYGFFWDDNFTYKTKKKSMGFLLYRFIQIINLKKTARMTKSFFAISPKTKKEADEFFKTDCTILTKPIENHEISDKEMHPQEKIKVLYTGNLKIGRLDTIKLISDVLDENKNLSDKFIFEIYSATEIKDQDSFNKSIKFMGSVSLDLVDDLQKAADILLLAEDVAEQSLVARLSFSTKTTDYLSHRKCILAIGNPEIASMEYLKETDSALLAYSKESLQKILEKIINNPQIINKYGEKAYKTGIKNHSREIMEERLRKVIGY